MTDINWKYIAGIIDGEGCIGIYHHNVKNRKKGNQYESIIPRVHASNTSVKLMDYLLSTGYGRVRPIPKGKRCKQCYDWEISSPEIIKEFLLKIRNYLIVKHNQCDLMLDFLENRVDMTKFRESNGRIKKMDIKSTLNWWYYLEFKRLNKKGR